MEIFPEKTSFRNLGPRKISVPPNSAPGLRQCTHVRTHADIRTNRLMHIDFNTLFYGITCNVLNVRHISLERGGIGVCSAPSKRRVAVSNLPQATAWRPWTSCSPICEEGNGKPPHSSYPQVA